MAYNEKLANKLREALGGLKNVEEKKMFSGLAFMVNGKMCINVSHDELMCRIDPDKHDEAIERNGCYPMVMKGKELKGYVRVSPEGFQNKKDFNYWVNLCLDFNKKAKATKKKK